MRHLPLWSMLLPFLLWSCVAGVEKRATSSEAAEGPPPSSGGEPSAMQVVAGTPVVAEEERGAGNAERVWVRGYWHWNGVRYVWIPAHWEQATPVPR